MIPEQYSFSLNVVLLSQLLDMAIKFSITENVCDGTRGMLSLYPLGLECFSLMRSERSFHTFPIPLYYSLLNKSLKLVSLIGEAYINYPTFSFQSLEKVILASMLGRKGS